MKAVCGLLLVALSLCAIAAAQNPPLTIANTSFPDGMVGREYLEALRFSGGCDSDLGPKPWFTVVEGALPPGLAIETPSNAGSVLTGTPTKAGAYSFTLQVADECNGSASKHFAITVMQDAGRRSVRPSRPVTRRKGP